MWCVNGLGILQLIQFRPSDNGQMKPALDEVLAETIDAALYKRLVRERVCVVAVFPMSERNQGA